MKAKYILMAGLAALALFSCSKRNVTPPEPEPLPPAKIVSITHDDAYGMTLCSIEYPSVDPYCHPVTLSAIITYGDEITEKNPACGMMLVNRVSAFGLGDSPSGGGLYGAKLMVGSRLVCVTPDLYGFGATKDKLQAYCMGNANSQASLDALLAARELMSEMNIPFEPGKSNQIFNAGYSQGAQTAIGVLKLAAEKYPDLHFAHTLVGSGPYDMPETFEFMLHEEVCQYPAPVIFSLISCNEYYRLGYTLADIFQPSVIPAIEQYLLSKDYSREESWKQFAPQQMQNFINSDFFDVESVKRKRFREAFAKDNLCTGWTPRKEERILLFSNPRDEVVPVSNTRSLYHFLVDEHALPHVEWYNASGVSIVVPDSVFRHTAAVADFGLYCATVLGKDYDIVWLPKIAQLIEELLV